MTIGYPIGYGNHHAETLRDRPNRRRMGNPLYDEVAVHLFVLHRPVEAVQWLLWVWEVPTWVCEVRAYKQLYQARLEAQRLFDEGGRVLVVEEA